MSELENKFDSLCEQVLKTVNAGNFPHGVIIECEDEEMSLNLAYVIANALVCEGENKPCGECSACRKASRNNHPDIYETDGRTKKSDAFTVDSIREIRSNAFIVPNEANAKVYILKNGQNMNEQAQNALLKILEEPPHYVYFIILTSQKSKMLETVLSRVSVYSIAVQNQNITDEEREYVKEFVKAILSPNELKLMEHTSKYIKNNRLAGRILELLCAVCRDALVQKSGFTGDFLFPEEVSSLCSSFTAKSLMNLVEVCNELSLSVKRNINNNLLTVRMCYEFKRAVGR
ncbi:MAG: hypothetical protein J1F24_03635 [Oscillospiraceae bacterium]|nr:hypothetical protein [Oscillospiraceae bacterium]